MMLQATDMPICWEGQPSSAGCHIPYASAVLKQQGLLIGTHSRSGWMEVDAPEGSEGPGSVEVRLTHMLHLQDCRQKGAAIAAALVRSRDTDDDIKDIILCIGCMTLERPCYVTQLAARQIYQ